MERLGYQNKQIEEIDEEILQLKKKENDLADKFGEKLLEDIFGEQELEKVITENQEMSKGIRTLEREIEMLEIEKDSLEKRKSKEALPAGSYGYTYTIMIDLIWVSESVYFISAFR